MLTIEDGGEVTDYYGYVGRDSGSLGTVTVTGAGSKWTNSFELIVGYNGSGTLTIEAGGEVSNTSATLATIPVPSVRPRSPAAGSKWTNSENLYVGYDGSGTLTVNDGGTVVVGKTLYASLDDLLGNGTISANGGVLDADLVFDAAHGSQNC